MNQAERIEALAVRHDLPDDELLPLLASPLDGAQKQRLYALAAAECEKYYGREVYLRGLIEFTSVCRNDCLYCGLRRSNTDAQRYRLTQDEILSCCRQGYALGLRTFVLQGGEDGYFTDARLCGIVRAIKSEFPDCAVTLSVGERSRESYAALYAAGAERYLLRHETADCEHYARLHPSELSAAHRQQCLYDLKDIGYQVGCGMMLGAPYQTPRHILADLRFMQRLQPHMIGMGPFIPHRDTPFAAFPAGTLDDTLRLLSIVRLMFPQVLLPATTALGTIHPQGREMGILAGANVIMPNLSPESVRAKYLLYDGKTGTDSEAAQNCEDLCRRMQGIGRRVVVSRGDHITRQGKR